MARIAGVDLTNEKKKEAGLTHIFGKGGNTSRKNLEKTGKKPDTKVKGLNEKKNGKIKKGNKKKFMLKGELGRDVNMNIKRLMEIGCYRGIRHRRGLPVRGQKTKTNARTRKGPKKTVGRKKK